MPDLPTRLAFVDVETTGGRVHTDRVIEVGVVRVEDGVITKKISQLLDPGSAIPGMITNITGITTEMVEQAPTFRQMADEIFDAIDGCTMVAHNVRFDYSFLKNEFAGVNIKFSPKHFCTVKLARQLYPQLSHHDLSTLINHFGFACDNRHRAYDDAKVLWDFYQLVLEQFDREQLSEMIAQITKKPTIPIAVEQMAVQQLPESPGVYIFYGDEEIPLYVGKSINIKTRVLSHFSADYASQTEMKIAQQTKRIDTIKTCGELGALLKESQLVKELTPLYNRKLRHCRQFVCLTQQQNADNYQTVQLQTYDTIAAHALSGIYGMFKSKSQAKHYLQSLCETHSLCAKLLGLEKTSSACFGYRLGKCNGACVGQENPAIYNLKLMTAIAQSRIKPWPYAGPILLMEHDQFEPKYDAFVIDQWCLVDQFAVNEDIQETDQELADCLDRLAQNHRSDETIYFDADAYRIIDAFLRLPKNRQAIHDLSALKSRVTGNEKQFQVGII